MSASSRVFAGVLAIAASSMLSLATPASAQGPGGPPAAPAPGGDAMSGLNIDLGTLLKAKAGAWADYTMTGKAPSGDNGAPKTVTIRYALVEHTASKVALEIISAMPKGEMVLHFDFVPAGADAWKVVSGKIQLGDQKMEIPSTKLASAPLLKTTDSPGVLIGTENLTTPAGAFPCKHYKKSMPEGPVLEIWMNDKVSPTGLVKTTLAAMGVQQTLVATGTGAQSKLQ